MEKVQLFRGDTILIKMSREAGKEVVNRKLNAINKLLMEESDRLQS
ncbi:unnamed protein product [Arabidopsis arenosa]|uniref:Uncharacterized protein n=1 Tax=Arabidopsis arenosa TaxID=38785 RepID=A0A8S2AVP9_ARAAE|nr:unnamed protein product [Arabidopsis arenosa]